MKKNRYIFIIMIIVMVLTIALFSERIIYIKSGKFFKYYFTEPFESMLVVFKDDDYMILTSNEPYKVDIQPWEFEMDLKKKNKSFEDILFIVHNHLTPIRFTPKNYRFYHWIRNQGFKRKFWLYYPHSRSIIDLDDFLKSHKEKDDG